MSAATKAKSLAKKLGCDLDVDKRHRTIEITLPKGKQITGNPGLNCRVNNCETLDDAWNVTLDNLTELLDGGMEPLEDPEKRVAPLRIKGRQPDELA